MSEQPEVPATVPDCMQGVTWQSSSWDDHQGIYKATGTTPGGETVHIWAEPPGHLWHLGKDPFDGTVLRCSSCYRHVCVCDTTKEGTA